MCLLFVVFTRRKVSAPATVNEEQQDHTAFILHAAGCGNVFSWVCTLPAVSFRELVHVQEDKIVVFYCLDFAVQDSKHRVYSRAVDDHFCLEVKD